MRKHPELLLIVCEGKTEVLYFNILQKQFRLPTWIKILPDLDKKYVSLGQHETLFQKAAQQREFYSQNLDIDEANIEVWAVCDRDDYKDSFTKLRESADEYNLNLAFSDPQFENFLLQHFSANKSKLSGKAVEDELSQCLTKKYPNTPIYKKSDLSWLTELIEEKNSIIKTAVNNANMHTNHTKQPFFTVQNLVSRLRDLVD